MITAIDTNILIDVFAVDSAFAAQSAALLRRALQEGTLHACPIVWAEAATFFDSRDDFLNAMQVLGVVFSPLTIESSLVASEIWQSYRRSGGSKQKVLTDFLIAAHALTCCDRLLTRDRGFYKKYFKNLVIIEPIAV